MTMKGMAIRMLAMPNEDTLAETRKARLTPARLTRDMVSAKQRKASKAGLNPGRVVAACKEEDRKIKQVRTLNNQPAFTLKGWIKMTLFVFLFPIFSALRHWYSGPRLHETMGCVSLLCMCLRV